MPDTNLIQNGADAVALFHDTSVVVGAAVTTTNLIDALVYDTDEADDLELLVLLNPGQPQVNENGLGQGIFHSNQRIPAGGGGLRNTTSYVQALPTPGATTNICGDGAVLDLEECDDNNTADGDGCSATCTVEHGWLCSGEPSVCEGTCGDGLIAVGDEECDDWNTSGSDGCSATCIIEHGWLCAGEPSVCEGTCGDGLIAVGLETCDDGNTSGTDGCTDTCEVENGWLCSGEPSICTSESFPWPMFMPAIQNQSQQ